MERAGKCFYILCMFKHKQIQPLVKKNIDDLHLTYKAVIITRIVIL